MVFLRRKRVASVAIEGTKGTFSAPTDSTDALPLLREATPNLEPIRVDRPTLRQSLTPYADIYPGQARITVDLLMELHGIAQGDANYEAPVWGDLMRACAFEELSDAAGDELHAYTGFTALDGGEAAPLRHGEAVSVAYGLGGPLTGVMVGDAYFNDDVLYINETGGSTGTGGITSITGGTSGIATSAGTVVRDTDNVIGWRLQSSLSAMETVSMYVYVDQKRWSIKGAMGNVELVCTHGDAIKARFSMTGVYSDYTDNAVPANANESHNVPPTFLGKDFRLSYYNGSATKVYGKDGSTVVGAINEFSISTGNNVVLRENSFDSAGFSYAIVTEREGAGSLNPDEVATSDFDFISRFVSGSTFRLRAMLGSTTATNANTIDVIAPGIVFDGMADGDRDGINVWDASFKLTGGDYDATAAGELPGNDNELTIIYR